MQKIQKAKKKIGRKIAEMIVKHRELILFINEHFETIIKFIDFIAKNSQIFM